jgi:hypothetical protein
MWWSNRNKIREASGEDAKIVALDAERIVRRRLYYQGDTNPSEDKVNKIVAQVVEKLKTEYGNLKKIRRTSPSESLNPIVEKAVRDILP